MSDIIKKKYSEKRRIGNIAEEIACMFLVKMGYKIIEQNYLKKWGELDIVASQNNIIHFIEVKSKVTREMEMNDNLVSQQVSRDSFTASDFSLRVSHENVDDEEYRPEDNVNFWKQKRMIRAIETYLLERRVSEDQEWQIDVITVKLDFFSKIATMKHIENVIFDI